MALVAVEAFLGTDPLDAEVVAAAFAEVTSPGRLEVIRRSPTIVLDAAHNPHGAEATAAALEDSFQLDPLVGVIGVMADKDAEGLLAAYERVLSHVVCTQNSTAARDARRGAGRRRPARSSARTASPSQPSLPDAIDQAVTIAESDSSGSSLGSGAVLVTGSVVTVGEARRLLRQGPRDRATTRHRPRGALAAPRHVRGDPQPGGRRARPHHAGDDLGRRRRHADGPLGRASASPSRALLLAGMLRGEWAYALGWALQGVAIGLGFVIPLMFVLGAIFALLWGTAYFLGRKIERERAERGALR